MSTEELRRRYEEAERISSKAMELADEAVNNYRELGRQLREAERDDRTEHQKALDELDLKPGDWVEVYRKVEIDPWTAGMDLLVGNVGEVLYVTEECNVKVGACGGYVFPPQSLRRAHPQGLNLIDAARYVYEHKGVKAVRRGERTRPSLDLYSPILKDPGRMFLDKNGNLFKYLTLNAINATYDIKPID